MALYTRQQICDLLKIKQAYLSVYIGRGKVLVDKKGFVDDQRPENALFIAKLSNVDVIKESVTSVRQSEPPPHSENITANTLTKIKAKKELKQIEKIEREISFLDGKISKANEESIPREHAVYLIKNYSLSIGNVWLSATRQFTSQKAISLQMTREEIIEYEKYIAGIMNEAMISGAEEANKNIRKLAKEFAGKKGRGEKE